MIMMVFGWLNLLFPMLISVAKHMKYYGEYYGG